MFWNSGMRIAFRCAMSDGGFSHYLWLNDDTRLDRTALGHLLATDRLLRGVRPPSIVVGSVRDPVTGDLTYGGVRRRSRWRPLRFSLSGELRRLRGVKVLPPADWFTFARRWAGWLWPVSAVSPYVRRLLRAARSS